MIYVGYYKEGLICADDVFLELKTMCEKDMIKFGKDNVDKLDGLFVNRFFLIDLVDADKICVIDKSGKETKMTDNPAWDKWKGEMMPGEFYTFWKFT